MSFNLCAETVKFSEGEWFGSCQTALTELTLEASALSLEINETFKRL
jgi:hypothetical protein